jgi:hypothetical protein
MFDKLVKLPISEFLFNANCSIQRTLTILDRTVTVKGYHYLEPGVARAAALSQGYGLIENKGLGSVSETAGTS